MTYHLSMHTGNVVYHASSPPFADVRVTSPFPNAWMAPITGTSQQPATQYIMAPHPHGGPCEQSDSGQNWRYMTIEMLPENTLLEIFDFYRIDAIGHSRGRPWKWHRLAHVCRKWRHVVQTSPRRLGLQIYCKSGASIERILGAWPTLPLVVRFKGTPKSRSLPNNILMALRHPDRVCEIDLRLTNSIIGSIAETLEEPFVSLRRVEMKSGDAKEPPVLANFLGGSAPLLEDIELNGIAVPFPAMRRLLLSANNLVRLWLIHIPNICYFSPESLVTCLSALVQLRKLYISFHSPTSRPAPSDAPPPLGRTTLPSLDSLVFHGASEYLEEFVARIDSPALTCLVIRFFNQLIFEIPQLCQFVSRVDGLKLIGKVAVTPAEKYGNITLTQRGPRRYQRGECYFGIPCSQLDWQLSFLTQILNQLSPLLLSVRLLSIMKTTVYHPVGKEDTDPTQWLELFQQLSHVSEVRVNLEEIVPNIVQALVSEDTTTGAFPNLTSLILKGYRKSPPVIEGAERFIATLKLAGRNVSLFG